MSAAASVAAPSAWHDGAADVGAGRFAHHGGRLCVARTLFPDAPQPWVDLSTGINPRAYPAPRASRLERNRLPQPTQLADLERTAAIAFGIDDPARVVAVGGTESGLRLLPLVLQLNHAAVLAPTYSSHLDAWRTSGIDAQAVSDAQLASCAETRVALTIVNPNNPDGRLVSSSCLRALHDSLAIHGGALIVDEAFVELTPQASVAGLAGSESAPRLLVLRSFGKFYGLAGVRLGFVVAAPAVAMRIRKIVGEWPVSADALRAGLAAYADREWAEDTRSRLKRSAERLDAVLVRAGFEIVGGTSLYRLARAGDAARRFARLLAAGILTRPFEHDPELLRFGLPHGAHEWRRLTDAHAVHASTLEARATEDTTHE